MIIFDFKVIPRSFSGDDATFGFKEIESLTDFYLELKFFVLVEANSIP